MTRMVALRTFTDAATKKLISRGTSIECSEAAAKRLAKQGVAKVEAGSMKRKKADMLRDAEKTMTKKELADAISKAKESPERGRRGRPHI